MIASRHSAGCEDQDVVSNDLLERQFAYPVPRESTIKTIPNGLVVSVLAIEVAARAPGYGPYVSAHRISHASLADERRCVQNLY